MNSLAVIQFQAPWLLIFLPLPLLLAFLSRRLEIFEPTLRLPRTLPPGSAWPRRRGSGLRCWRGKRPHRGNTPHRIRHIVGNQQRASRIKSDPRPDGPLPCRHYSGNR